MKAIKLLLSAFVVSAMFASCAKEVTPQQEILNGEFVGAELLGTDVAVNFSTGATTKLDANGDWESTDKLGLGWVLNSGSAVTDLQVPGVEPADALYGNHMFQLSSNGQITTKGNVYVGWHFGYYPFKYQDRLGQQLSFDLNPQQTEKGGDVERYNSGLYLSAREFLTTKNLDENNQLTGVEYAIYPVLKTISVNLSPEATFTGSDVLSTLNISKVIINVGANNGAFPTGKVNVVPSKLAKIQYDYNETTKENVYNAEKTKVELYKSLTKALTHSGWHSEISVSPLSKEINLSGAQVVRVHTLPVEVTLDPAKVVFTILVDNGAFTVRYTDPKTLEKGKELTQAQKDNNAAIEAFVKAYAKDGVLSAYNFNKETGEYRPGKNVDLTLTADPYMFKEDFTRISSEEIWNKAVAMVDDLGIKEASFTIVAGKDGKPWNFVDEDKDGKLINLPKTAKVTVSGTMNLGANGEWPSKGIVANNVTVNKNCTLTVADNVVLDATITNNGTIKVGKLAKVKTVDNTNGRIEVVYGSYVKVDANKDGVIAYEVTGEDKAYQINALTNPNVDTKERNAFVNTLVINNNRSFNLSMIDNNLVDNDPYTGTIVNGQKLERMHTMSIELNNGTLAADANSGAIVAKVDVLGGDNAIWNTNIKGKLTINAGNVTLDAAKVGTYKESLKVEGEIDNKKGELVANTSLYTPTIKNPADAKTFVKAGESIWYTTKYIQGGTATGTIEKLANLPGVFTEVDAVKEIPAFATASDDKGRAAALASYIKSSDFKEGSTIKLPAVVVELTGNGNDQFTKSFNLVGVEGTVVKSTHPTSPTTARGIKVVGTKDNNVVVNIKNLTLESEEYVLYAKEYATVNLQNVVCKSNKGVAFLIDNSNCQESNTTTVNAYNVTIDKDDIIWLNALPCTSYPGVKKVSYVKFNYFGGNITDAACKAQDITRSTGDNLFINGIALPAYK